MTKSVYRLPDTIRHPKKRAMLTAFAKSGAVRRACSSAGVHHSTYYEWRGSDPVFADAADEAREHYTEWLESVADERATTGKRPSDTLLIFRLKALRPSMYRERHKVHVTDERINDELDRIFSQMKAQYAVACPDCSCNRCVERRHEVSLMRHETPSLARTAVLDTAAKDENERVTNVASGH